MNEWKVVCHGDGETWEHTDLTFEQANKKLLSMPLEYTAYIVPMEV